jgi:hypothetical protein
MNLNRTNGDPTPPAPPEESLVVLDDVYEPAFLGPSFSVAEPPRVAYCLVKLVEIEQARIATEEGVGAPDTARRSILALMQAATEEHGARAPLFIDTEQGEALRAPRILRPGELG